VALVSESLIAERDTSANDSTGRLSGAVFDGVPPPPVDSLGST
jgi:hypothetical protein